MDGHAGGVPKWRLVRRSHEGSGEPLLVAGARILLVPKQTGNMGVPRGRQDLAVPVGGRNARFVGVTVLVERVIAAVDLSGGGLVRAGA